MILATVFWGASYLITKWALQEISTVSFLFFRYAVASVSLVPLFLLHPISLNKQLIKQGIYLSLLQTIVMFGQTMGLATISASLSSFVTGFYIVFGLLIRFFVTKKLPDVFDMLTSAMCLGGLGLLTNSFGATDLVGVGYTFLGALFIAIYIYVLDRYVTPATAFTLTFLQMVGIMTSFGCVLLLQHDTFQFPHQLSTWGAIMLAGLGCSSLAHFLHAKAQPKLGAFKVSIILMLEPVFATLFAYWGLDERLYPMSFVGIGMILIAIAAINWRLKKI